jgi:hypothetical protein
MIERKMNELEQELLPLSYRDHEKRPDSPRRVNKPLPNRATSARVIKDTASNLVRISSERGQINSNQHPRTLQALKSRVNIEEINVGSQTAPVLHGEAFMSQHQSKVATLDKERITSFIQNHKDLGIGARLICKKKRESKSIFRMTRAVISDTRATSVFRKDKPWPKLSNKILLSEAK